MASQPIQSCLIPGSNYGYTGINVETLKSFENTLVTGLFDESGSTTPFARQIEECAKTIVKSLGHSTRKDNIMYRQCHFGTGFREHHGYLTLPEINLDKYDGCYQPGGETHLYDSLDRVVAELLDYAARQAARKYTCNGMVFAVTDGQDYGSKLTQKDIQRRFSEAVTGESLESLITILIGINKLESIQKSLENFAAVAGFSKYIPVEKADEDTLAKIGDYVSSMVISQSQALGTGGPSKVLKF